MSELMKKIGQCEECGDNLTNGHVCPDVKRVHVDRVVMPPVLDACCGTRMFWFDKSDARSLFIDRREGRRVIDVGTPGTKGRRPKVVDPDKLVDFRDMPFGENSFFHVVFDPPHFYKGAGKTGRIAFDYGLLDETWREDIKKKGLPSVSGF